MTQSSLPTHAAGTRTKVDSASLLANSSSRDQALTEIRSGRRLDKVVGSIEGFLTNQILRLEQAISECECAVENDRIVKDILARFEEEKRAWNQARQAEIQRLNEAGQELIQAWEKLDSERQQWREKNNAQ